MVGKNTLWIAILLLGVVLLHQNCAVSSDDGTITNMGSNGVPRNCDVSDDVAETTKIIAGGSVQSGYPASYAFDNVDTNVTSITSSSSTFVGQQFDSPKKIVGVKIYRNGIGSHGFHAKLQYSDDNSTWTDSGLVINQGPNDPAWHTYEVSAGSHIYWRFLDTQAEAWFQVNEIEMLEEVCR